jgi:hypothetical protein
MPDNSKALAFHAEQVFNLAGCEFGNGNDEIRPLNCFACLPSEAAAKFAGRLVAGTHKEVVKRRDGTVKACPWKPLIQTVEKAGSTGRLGIAQQAAFAVARKPKPEGPEKAVRTVAEKQCCFRMRRRQTQQDLSRIDPHSGEVLSYAVGGV